MAFLIVDAATFQFGLDLDSRSVADGTVGQELQKLADAPISSVAVTSGLQDTSYCDPTSTKPVLHTVLREHRSRTPCFLEEAELLPRAVIRSISEAGLKREGGDLVSLRD